MFFEVLVCLLGKYGVAINDVDVKKTGEVKIDIDFSKHDKVFEDKIAEQKNEISMLKSLIDNYRDVESKLFDENQELKKHIAELESKETEKLTKINLNDRIKVKLTPLGAEIYYHMFDDTNKKAKKTIIEPHLPKVDEKGYTEFTLWGFINTYGQYIDVGKPDVIDPIDIIACE